MRISSFWSSSAVVEVVTTTSWRGHLMLLLVIPPSLPEQEPLSSPSEMLESTSMMTSVSHSSKMAVCSNWILFGCGTTASTNTSWSCSTEEGFEMLTGTPRSTRRWERTSFCFNNCCLHKSCSSFCLFRIWYEGDKINSDHRHLNHTYKHAHKHADTHTHTHTGTCTKVGINKGVLHYVY